MRRAVVVLLVLLLAGLLKLPVERALASRRPGASVADTSRAQNFRGQVGQLSLAATLGGFRSVAADLLYLRAHLAWERTDWSRLVFLFEQITTLQPHRLLYWETGAWHMAWNAGTAALNDPAEPRQSLRVQAQRRYFDLARAFLERGIQLNPDRPQLYEALARLYREKYQDHLRASEYFSLAAARPGAPGYLRRFAAYELSYCAGREPEAYSQLRALHDEGEHERLPTLIRRLKFLEETLKLPVDQRIP